MENSILIIAIIILVLVLAISVYFLTIKKKDNEISNNTKPFIEDKQTTIIPEKDTETSTKEDLEIIIDKKVEKIPVEEIKEIIKPTELPKKEPKKATKTNEEIPTDTGEVQPKLTINISSKTEKVLLKKLEAFEKSKDFLKKDVNLNNLANKFDTNTKYLSEIIKSYKNKNFNQYLNELRIHHLIEQLNTNDKVLNTKVSYLASDFGFNSHSSFSTLFTQYVGQSPSEYIKALKKSKKEKITE